MVFELPWWFFALTATILLAVVVVSWSPSRRFAPPVNRGTAIFRTSPLFLGWMAVFFAGAQMGIIPYYDGLWSIASPHAIGPIVCSIAAIVAFRRWQLDPPNTAVDAPAKSTPPPKHGAVIGGIVSCVNVGVLTVVWGSGIVASQVAYLIAHNGQPPEIFQPNAYPAEIWRAHMLFPLPWWVLVLNGVIMLGVLVYIWPTENRFAPVNNRARVLMTTTPLFLAIQASIMFFVQTSLTLWYLPEGFVGLYAIGPVLCGVAVVFAFFVWRWRPEPAGIRETKVKLLKAQKGADA